jgi:tetratricopeptide (TPR) repeat protein
MSRDQEINLADSIGMNQWETTLMNLDEDTFNKLKLAIPKALWEVTFGQREMNIDHKKLNLALPMAKQGRRSMQAGQYEEAIALFTQAIEVYPDYAEAYMGRGYSKHFLSMGESYVLEDFQNAENAYRRVMSRDQERNLAFPIGMVQCDTRVWDATSIDIDEETLNKLKLAMPKSLWEATFGRRELNIDQEKLNVALPMAKQGRRSMQAGQYEEAIALFTQAIEVYPDYAEAYMGRAYTKHTLGMGESSVLEDFQNAENAYRRRRQTIEADNVADSSQQWQREKPDPAESRRLSAFLSSNPPATPESNQASVVQTDPTMRLIERCRGIELTDCNDWFVLVKGPIETVAPAFAQLRHASVWQQDVYDREIEMLGQDFIVFQFRGHSWTLIHHLGRLGHLPREGDAEALAQQLDTEAIYYRVSDTACYIGYQLYDRTGLVERFSSESGSRFEFESKRPQALVEELGSLGPYTCGNFIKQQDAYVPYLPKTFLSEYTVGQRFILRLKTYIDDPSRPRVFGPVSPITLERDDFERCDYVGSKVDG